MTATAWKVIDRARYPVDGTTAIEIVLEGWDVSLDTFVFIGGELTTLALCGSSGFGTTGRVDHF